MNRALKAAMVVAAITLVLVCCAAAVGTEAACAAPAPPRPPAPAVRAPAPAPRPAPMPRVNQPPRQPVQKAPTTRVEHHNSPVFVPVWVPYFGGDDDCD